MIFKTFQIVKELENCIETGYSLKIFKGYRAINKRGVEKLIAEIYENLPDDIENARNYLKENNIDLKINDNSEKENIYTKLQILKSALNKSFNFAQFIILNIKEIEKIINQIYDNLPDEIIKVNNIEKQ